MVEAVGRNQPCPCGSGKKFKKCCSGRKARILDVYLDLGENPSPVDAVQVSSSGKLSLLYRGQPVRVERSRIEVSYERSKTPKILQRIVLDPDFTTTDVNAELRRYDGLYGIDTNTRLVGGRNVSATVAVQCVLQPLDSERYLAQVVPVLSFTFEDEAGSCEGFGWRETITRIQATSWYTAELRIGLVVDSDLPALTAYNDRERPIHEDFYLPMNFELSYASAEVARDGLANFMLARCDREARAMLDGFEANGLWGREAVSPPRLAN